MVTLKESYVWNNQIVWNFRILWNFHSFRDETHSEIKSCMYEWGDVAKFGICYFIPIYSIKRKKRKGYMQIHWLIATSAVSWCSRLQRIVVLSVTEASKDAIRLACPCNELGLPTRTAVVHFRNWNAICLATKPMFHVPTDCINVWYHFIREVVDWTQSHCIKSALHRILQTLSTDCLSKAQHQHFLQLVGVT